MQKKLILLAGAFTFLLIITAGCSKKNDTAPAGTTKTDLIAKATWKFSNATVGGIPVGPFLEECETDNKVTFVAAGTGTADEGVLKCDAGDPQTVSFTWNFQTNETVLFVSTPLFTGGSGMFTIVSLTETTLVVSQNINVSGSSQNAVITFIH